MCEDINMEKKPEEDLAKKFHELELSTEDAICICKRESPDGPKILNEHCLANHEYEKPKPPDD